MENVYSATDRLSIYHTPFYILTPVAMTPERLRKFARWNLTFSSTSVESFLSSVPRELFTLTTDNADFDCRWSIEFVDGKGVILVTIDFDDQGRGRVGDQPVVINAQLFEKLRLIAKSINPMDVPR